jgi:hypothetical protein
VFWGVQSKTPTISSWRAETDGGNFTHIRSILLCHPAKNFLQFVSLQRSVARCRHNEEIDKQNILEK